MNALARMVFTGRWKSFKVFKRNGDILLNTGQNYRESHFTPDSLLTIRKIMGDAIEQVARTDQWTVELQNKHHYLRLPLYKLLYEVVTVNHTVLVLSDPVSMDKIFLAKEAYWHSALQSNTSIIF